MQRPEGFYRALFCQELVYTRMNVLATYCVIYVLCIIVFCVSYTAIMYYRQAVQLDPDVEFKAYRTTAKNGMVTDDV